MVLKKAQNQCKINVKSMENQCKINVQSMSKKVQRYMCDLMPNVIVRLDTLLGHITGIAEAPRDVLCSSVRTLVPGRQVVQYGLPVSV